MTEQQGPASTPPGWYDDHTGRLRWWDGQQWGVAADEVPAPAPGPTAATPPVAATATGTGMDSKSMAMLCHLLAIFTGFLGPLIIYLINGEKDPFVRHHAAESLNFQITVTIAAIASAVLIIVLIGIIMLPVVVIGALVLEVIGAMRANAGQWWRYPVNLRIVPGAVG